MRDWIRATVFSAPFMSGRQLLHGSLLALGAFLFLPNFLMLLLSRFLFMERSLVNLDYLLLGIAAPWLGAVALTILFAVFLALDFVLALAPGFHLMTTGVLQSLGDSLLLDRFNALLTAGVVLLGIAAVSIGAFFLIRPVSGKHGANVAVLVVAVVVAAGDMLFSANNFLRFEQPFLDVNIATSSLNKIRGARNQLAQSDFDGPAAYDVPSATAVLFERLEQDRELPPRVMLVVVESMGFFHDERANALQMRALDNEEIRQRYAVTLGTVPFVGSTVAGELRELCRVTVFTLEPDASLLPVRECLPALLGQRGYHSVAVHGFAGSFFSRVQWYPKLAFDDILFGPAVERAAGRRTRCGLTFRGTCDGTVTDWLSEWLKEGGNERVFVYWLTLNGHVPLGRPDPARTTLDCGHSAPTAESSAVCRLVRHHDIVLNGLVEIMLAQDQPPTAFVVVGDHMPHFIGREARALFDETRVPYAVVWPNAELDVDGEAER